MSQPDLFEARARSTDPGTSHEAAASVGKIRESQARILNLYKIYGPMSDDELYPHVSQMMSPSGARSRRSELVLQNLIKDSGKRGLTKLNRKTIIWCAVEG